MEATRELNGESIDLRDEVPSDATVLITGETGTGKELIARAIHKRSRRSRSAFTKMNCAVTPPSLIASELFGYERGVFTGANQRHAGRFEAANRGTFFLTKSAKCQSKPKLPCCGCFRNMSSSGSEARKAFQSTFE